MQFADESLPGNPAHFFPAGEDVLIGTSTRCNLRLSSSKVSRIHALIFKDNQGTLRIRDLGSTHGTFVRGQLGAGEERELKQDDLVLIGDHKLRLTDPGRDAAPGGGVTQRPTNIPSHRFRLFLWIDPLRGVYLRIVPTMGGESGILHIPYRENDVVGGLLVALVGRSRVRPLFGQHAVPGSSPDSKSKAVSELKKKLKAFQDGDPVLKALKDADGEDVHLGARLLPLRDGYAVWDLHDLVEEVIVSHHPPPTR